jgi:hyperosmotically inducible periplasmic protein
MRSSLRASLLAALALTLTMYAQALAQSASESMHEAGESAESAVSHAYHGTKTAAVDTSLTAKVKTALHDDKATSGADIHVTTVASVVTLRGRVASADLSSRAEQIAEHTTGVKAVKNELKVE